ncbi:MAG: type IV pilin protein [Pirellulaceae bacterium]
MKNTRGFTLIELMITIAILAIIVGIAIPAYNGQVEKSRRADAIAGLLQAAQQMERCFTRTNTYLNCSIPETSPDGHYAIDDTNDTDGDATRTATTYTLEANPTGDNASGAQESDNCGTFTLDHLGIKGADGADSDRCWGS